MTDLSRVSVFMPTIKCSSCGDQVEISMMGDHICKPAAPAAEPVAPQPATTDRLGGAFSSLKLSVFDKLTRAAPPNVDTSAATTSTATGARGSVGNPGTDGANTKLDQVTPISTSTGSRAISPKTPNGPSSAAPNGEDYFGPAIAESPTRMPNSRLGGYGGLEDPEGSERHSQLGTSPEREPSSVLRRMNTIAPGPFEMGRPPSAGTNSFQPSSNRFNLTEPRDDGRRPSTASSMNGVGIAPPRVPRNNSYGGFGPPQRSGDSFEPPSLNGSKRSETFPKPSPGQPDESPARTPSAPGLRPDRIRSGSTNAGDAPAMTSERSQRPSLSIKDTSRPPPPRKSLMRPTTRDGSAAPNINLAAEFGANNPYHSPSLSQVSQSSSNSGYSQCSSQPSQTSSSTSPARSVGARRKASDGTNVDGLTNDLESSIEALNPSGPPPVPRGPPVESAAAGVRKAPEGLRLDPAIWNGRRPSAGSPLQSPMFSNRGDPVIQAARRPSAAGSPPLPSPSLFPTRTDPAIQEGQNRSSHRPSHSRQPSRPDQRSRGNCKACGELITGKSISSADGRLTGRYHKACFVCATCREPFAGTTFYVLEDKPYCEYHYHKLNGSLCGSCDKGIEGQYLEDEASKKYHVGCFRCRDCGVVLRDGYFDLGGVAYCERDAVRRVQMAARQPSLHAPPRSLPYGAGLPAGPSPPPPGALNRPFGMPMGQRLAPGQALGRGALGGMPRMQKRMTRLGMMGA
ncbi:hypothetical protein DL763_002740 [Monosporascus cannonballus]|nr:hypothetical protein DL763_002740 [Monosporascus cannonballus]